MNSKVNFLPFLLTIVLLFTSCGGRDISQTGDESTTTGWTYNDPDWGGFEVVEAYDQQTGPGLVFIEGGSFTMGRVEQDILYDWNNVPRRVTLTSFYMDETEVRNVDYLEYLYWIGRVFSDMFKGTHNTQQARGYFFHLINLSIVPTIPHKCIHMSRTIFHNT